MPNEKINPKIVFRKIAGVIYYEIEYYCISDNQTHIGYGSYDIAVILGFLREYFDIPTADVKLVVRGEWIEKQYIKGGFRKIKGFDINGQEVSIYKDCRIKYDDKHCSICNKINGSNFFNFCPHCGAKMDYVTNHTIDGVKTGLYVGDIKDGENNVK